MATEPYIPIAEKSAAEQEVSDKYDIQGWTGFTFKGRGGKYSKFQYNFNHFTASPCRPEATRQIADLDQGVDYNHDGGRTAIYKIHGDGKDWAQGVDDENANYDYLMGADIDHRHAPDHSIPARARDLTRVKLATLRS